MMKNKYFSSFANVLTVISIITMCIYTILAFMNVIARYIFLKPFAWTEEITTLLFVLGVFLIQIGLELYDRQLSISFISQKIKNKTVLKVLHVLERLIVAGLLLIVIKEAFPVIQRNYLFETTTVILRIPLWPLYAVIAAVLLIIALINLGKAFGLFVLKR